MFKGTWRGMDVAIKECEANSNPQAKQIADMMEKEIKIHVNLSHKNVLPMFGYSRKGKEVLLVAQLMDGALDSILYPEDSKCKLKKREKSFIIREMLQ